VQTLYKIRGVPIPNDVTRRIICYGDASVIWREITVWSGLRSLQTTLKPTAMAYDDKRIEGLERDR
jgi:hypothetical protein